MDRKKMLSLGAVVACCPLALATAEPPRFNLVPVPSLEGGPGECCDPIPVGWGADALLLGTDYVSTKSGGQEKRGMIWLLGQEPVDLAGTAWKTAFPAFVNDGGWIAGLGVPWTGTDCQSPNNLQHIFLRSPEGELTDLYDSGDCDERIALVGMSENGSVIFTQYTIPDPLAKLPYVVHSDGTLVALQVPVNAIRLYELSDISPDGSIITALFQTDAGSLAVRWVDGELEELSMPSALFNYVFPPFLSIGPDGTIIATMKVGSNWRPIRWNQDGQSESLPVPASAGDYGAEFIFEDLIVGWTDIDDERYVVLWYLEDGEVVDSVMHGFGPDYFLGGWDAVGRAGELLVLKTLDETDYTTETFVLPIKGDELILLHDTIVLGDLSGWGPSGDQIIWTANYCNRHCSSFVMDISVKAGRLGSFVLDRLRPGDVNGDHVVDGADLAEILGTWGTNNPAADLDGDGVVSGSDLSIALGHWG